MDIKPQAPVIKVRAVGISLPAADTKPQVLGTNLQVPVTKPQAPVIKLRAVGTRALAVGTKLRVVGTRARAVDINQGEGTINRLAEIQISLPRQSF